MFDHSSNKKTRIKVMMRVEMDDGEERLLFIFPIQGQRVQDALNDERKFLPVETSDGEIELLRKDFIRRATPMENLALERHSPYDVLGISETATDAEVRSAYHRTITPVHPDNISALNLPPDFVQLANRMAAQVNEAYARIRRQRGKSSEGGDFET